MNDFKSYFPDSKGTHGIKRNNEVCLLWSSESHFMRMYTQSTDKTKAILMIK